MRRPSEAPCPFGTLSVLFSETLLLSIKSSAQSHTLETDHMWHTKAHGLLRVEVRLAHTPPTGSINMVVSWALSPFTAERIQLNWPTRVSDTPKKPRSIFVMTNDSGLWRVTNVSNHVLCFKAGSRKYLQLLQLFKNTKIRAPM